MVCCILFLLVDGFKKTLGLFRACIRERLAMGVLRSVGFSLRFWEDAAALDARELVEGVFLRELTEDAFFIDKGVRIVEFVFVAVFCFPAFFLADCNISLSRRF